MNENGFFAIHPAAEDGLGPAVKVNGDIALTQAH
jgi:hypothetical protein